MYEMFCDIIFPAAEKLKRTQRVLHEKDVSFVRWTLRCITCLSFTSSWNKLLKNILMFLVRHNVKWTLSLNWLQAISSETSLNSSTDTPAAINEASGRRVRYMRVKYSCIKDEFNVLLSGRVWKRWLASKPPTYITHLHTNQPLLITEGSFIAHKRHKFSLMCDLEMSIVSDVKVSLDLVKIKIM